MVNGTSIDAAPKLLPSASLHHRRQQDECCRVYRHRDQERYDEHQPDRGEYPVQRPGIGHVVEATFARNWVHDEGLPGGKRCHTSVPTGDRSTGG